MQCIPALAAGSFGTLRGLRLGAMTKRNGITLAEVLILIVIIGVLVALLIALLMPSVQSARKVARTNEERQRFLEFEEPQPSPEAKSREPADEVSAAEDVAATPRKIIYQAAITIVVDDVAQTEKTITELVKQYGGYVADSSVDRQQGEQLWGRWQVRIPVDKFGPFLDAVSKLGIAETRNQTAQDVTEEYVDLEARIANKKKLEARIVELLGTTSDKITDVLEVERELARVRGEIEQMEGRRRYLTNRTELTTVSIIAREEHDYVPPAAPTFRARIQNAWGGTLVALRDFGQDVAVAAVYVFPWAVIFGILLLPPLWIVGRRRARMKRLADGEQQPG